MTEARTRINDKDVPKMFATHLGGGHMQARLRQKGWSDEAIGKECVRIINEERAAINEYCQMDMDEIENPAWRMSLLYHTAMQMLNEREGVRGKELTRTEKAKLPDEEQQRQPVQSWYDTDADDDFDDLEGYFN